MLRIIPALALAAVAAPAIAQPSNSPTPPKPQLDRTILHVQVILDKLGYGPGVLDGLGGQSLTAALKGYQKAHGLPETGKPDARTLGALKRFAAWRPTRTVTLDEAAIKGPFTNPLPKDPALQAKLPALGYRNPVEALAERFHTNPATLVALNPGARIRIGSKLVVPNALPFSRDYETEDPAWRATLNSLNVNAQQPVAARVLVDESDGVLRVFDKGGRMVAQFPATMGSKYDPLPIGNWTIKGTAFNPPFHYNPDLFWDADSKDEKAKLPPGPNSPVGVVWIDLSKPHYGIHGTPEPQTIGRAESHGCIRLTNWDAARLALMVKSGVPVVFQR